MRLNACFANASLESSKLNRLQILTTWSLDRQFFDAILLAVESLVSSKLLLLMDLIAAAKLDAFIGQPLHPFPLLLLELELELELLFVLVVVVVVVVTVSENTGSFTETFMLTPLIFTFALTPLVVDVVVVVRTVPLLTCTDDGLP